MEDGLLWLLNLIINRFITFKLKDVGYPFRLNKEIMESFSVFRNESFDEYE